MMNKTNFFLIDLIDLQKMDVNTINMPSAYFEINRITNHFGKRSKGFSTSKGSVLSTNPTYLGRSKWKNHLLLDTALGLQTGIVPTSIDVYSMYLYSFSLKSRNIEDTLIFSTLEELLAKVNSYMEEQHQKKYNRIYYKHIDGVEHSELTNRDKRVQKKEAREILKRGKFLSKIKNKGPDSSTIAVDVDEDLNE